MLPDFERPVNFLAGKEPVPEGLRRLMELEGAEFAAVLGQPLVVDGTTADSTTDAWYIRIDPLVNCARLEADPLRRTLTATVTDPSQIGEGLNLLHSLAHETGTVVEDAEVASYAAAFDRIDDEIKNIYPYFQLRNLNWDLITDRYRHVRNLRGREFWTEASKWIAELGDAHTQLLSPQRRHHPPYIARMDASGATFVTVPHDSDAWRAGVRPGDKLKVDNGTYWLDTVGATPQHHALVAGRRFMMMTNFEREFTCLTQDGQSNTWIEHARSRPSLSVDKNCITIHQFTPDVPERLRRVIASLKGKTGTLTVDLRGNTGGNLIAAAKARRLLLSQDGVFGTVQFTDGRGSLAASAPLEASRHEDAWDGQTNILVDAMTYSAAEDFLHPLVGQANTQIHGGPTGGGSGRPHTRALLDGYRLSVSTAITYTRDGRAIEYHGIG